MRGALTLSQEERPMRKMSDLVRDQQPLTMPGSANVMEAARQMRDRRVGAVLVTTDNTSELIGIFTGRDAVGRVLAEGKDPAKTALREVMTPNPETMTPRHKAIDALRLMEDVRCRHLPIVREGMILGIVSRGDFRGIEIDRLDEETGLWERIG
jgi:CBS domain-containing protein